MAHDARAGRRAARQLALARDRLRARAQDVAADMEQDARDGLAAPRPARARLCMVARSQALRRPKPGLARRASRCAAGEAAGEASRRAALCRAAAVHAATPRFVL